MIRGGFSEGVTSRGELEDGKSRAMGLSGTVVGPAEGTANAKSPRREQLETFMNMERARAAGVA